MYRVLDSTTGLWSSTNHIKDWICPQCKTKNKRTRLSCKKLSCFYYHLPEYSTPEPQTASAFPYKTTSIQQQRLLLFYGYIRPININTLIPKDIIASIDFYFPQQLSWKIPKTLVNVKFIEAHDCIYSRDGQLCIIHANNIINSSKCKTFSWEINIWQSGYPTFIGFVLAPSSKSIPYANSVDEFGCYEGQYGLKMYNITQGDIGRACRKLPDKRRSHSAIFLHVRLCRDARFRFEFDFKQKTCHLYQGEWGVIREPMSNQRVNFYPNPIPSQFDDPISIIPTVCLSGRAEYKICNGKWTH